MFQKNGFLQQEWVEKLFEKLKLRLIKTPTNEKYLNIFFEYYKFTLKVKNIQGVVENGE